MRDPCLYNVLCFAACGEVVSQFKVPGHTFLELKR